MDLQQLHDKSGITKRKLRYCLDHQLVPGLDILIAPDEVGRPRKFADDVGFGIVCAAKLLELGLPHEVIRQFLNGLLHVTLSGRGPEKSALMAILNKSTRAFAHLGDSLNIRLAAEDLGFDSGWFIPGNPAKISADYRPALEVVLDLGQIRDMVLGSK